MKYRIREEKTRHLDLFYPQYKRLFIWRYFHNKYGYDRFFDSLEKAKEWLDAERGVITIIIHKI